MSTLPRFLNLQALLGKKSHFLFGPRSTGKTSLINSELKSKATVINLLRVPIMTRLSSDPGELESIIDAEQAAVKKTFVVLDEIQKVPALLDEVHRLIEERKIRFLLSGSSARKLKATGVNLLGGRAWIANLFSLTCHEIPNFDLDRYLRYGGLPHVYLSDYPDDELQAYVATYINEEIKMEGLVRKIPAFLSFLRMAALTNTQQVNFTKLGNDAGVSATTIREYYGILEDTLIGVVLEPWSKSKKRKAVSTGKFYFFDTGVCHTLADTKALDRNSDLYGRSFEHWVFMELRAYLSYTQRKEKLRFWRSQDQKEVDFVIGDEIGIEVKSTKKLSSAHYSGIHALQEEGLVKRFCMVSHESVNTKKGNVLSLHWKSFAQKLWNGELI
ncbi:MAG: ATP-binding protein [Deltaproteobacteria bacterium]|nr:ATP-binding protein [Deltaproteobacteria bacterium]